MTKAQEYKILTMIFVVGVLLGVVIMGGDVEKLMARITLLVGLVVFMANYWLVRNQ